VYNHAVISWFYHIRSKWLNAATVNKGDESFCSKALSSRRSASVENKRDGMVYNGDADGVTKLLSAA
jgi:hypothetical protein